MENELLILHAGRPGHLEGRLGETLRAAWRAGPSGLRGRASPWRGGGFSSPSPCRRTG